MAVRYLTYDIVSGNDYDELYEFLEEINAVKVTESTYKIEANIKFDGLCELLKKITTTGDKVSLIYRTDDSISHKVIR